MKLKNALQFLLILLIISSCGSAVSEKENILFIGNSYTYRNKGIDQHVVSLEPKSLQQKNYVSRAAKGKYHLKTHYYDFETQAKLEEHTWNKVVLQEYSSGSVTDRDQFYYFGKKWAKKIRAKHPKTKIYLYSTWGYKNTHLMVDSINTAYYKLGKEIDATVIPVGKMWQEVQPTINLYDNTDNAHPNRKGTFITACLFYEYLHEKDVRKTADTDPKIPKWQQRKLKQLAHEFHEDWLKNHSN